MQLFKRRLISQINACIVEAVESLDRRCIENTYQTVNKVNQSTL